ncbi:MAG: SURF1 family protein [Ascidiaceihabitans sp.]|nr:SURF1 family protein [Ascidiaceihabitans sp.]
MKRLIFFLGIGLGGAGILISLGVWQIQRLTWKQAILDQIQEQIVQAPVALPVGANSGDHSYLSVTATGTVGTEFIRVLVSKKDVGAGYRVISKLQLANQSILLDRGFIPASATISNAPDGPVTIIGNLQWPQETDSYTPDPDIAKNIWFARDVDVMAKTLETAPIMLIAREKSFDDARITPFPVDTVGIPNDHLQYAITWFSLAAIWLLMSLYFLRPTKQSPTKQSRDI